MANPRPDPVERNDQAARVFEMRRKGLIYEQIAEAEGCSISTAHKRYREALLARIPVAAEEERQLEVARYDSWLELLHEQLALFPAKAEKIVPVLLKVSERRARLMGLDAPTRVTASVEAGSDVVELAQTLRDAIARDGVRDAALQNGDKP